MDPTSVTKILKVYLSSGRWATSITESKLSKLVLKVKIFIQLCYTINKLS